ncbi:MAG TPA: 50S ribosomal protein L24e [Candidatus Nanoarchaeia archaeon]|nr:50S ribosomal protein L24e [Candidatus Nanoarchaeia archaeon]
MVKCSFCGKNIEQGTGKMLIKNIGTVSYYCSNKCEKNNRKLNRDPRKLGWTEAYRILKSGVKTQEKPVSKKKKKEVEPISVSN